MNFNTEPQKGNNCLASKPNKEMCNSVYISGENAVKPSEKDKYQKKIYKMEQHHQQ